MLRQDSRGEYQPNTSKESKDFDVLFELNQLEEIILNRLHIPLTGLAVVDREKLLSQLDSIRNKLPDAFEHAAAIIRQKEAILEEAQTYAHEITEVARERAAEILDEIGIVQQAELQAAQIRLRVEQECEQIRRQAILEVEEIRIQAQQQIEQWRKVAIAECQDIQNGADDYADRVLDNLEQQLIQMLTVIRNGRQELEKDSEEL